MTRCIRCGRPAPVHYYCDREDVGPRCFDCFRDSDCIEHPEGCATRVLEDEAA